MVWFVSFLTAFSIHVDMPAVGKIVSCRWQQLLVFCLQSLHIGWHTYCFVSKKWQIESKCWGFFAHLNFQGFFWITQLQHIQWQPQQSKKKKEVNCYAWTQGALCLCFLCLMIILFNHPVCCFLPSPCLIRHMDSKKDPGMVAWAEQKMLLWGTREDRTTRCNLTHCERSQKSTQRLCSSWLGRAVPQPCYAATGSHPKAGLRAAQGAGGRGVAWSVSSPWLAAISPSLQHTVVYTPTCRKTEQGLWAGVLFCAP